MASRGVLSSPWSAVARDGPAGASASAPSPRRPHAVADGGKTVDDRAEAAGGKACVSGRARAWSVPPNAGAVRPGPAVAGTEAVARRAGAVACRAIRVGGWARAVGDRAGAAGGRDGSGGAGVGLAESTVGRCAAGSNKLAPERELSVAGRARPKPKTEVSWAMTVGPAPWMACSCATSVGPVLSGASPAAAGLVPLPAGVGSNGGIAATTAGSHQPLQSARSAPWRDASGGGRCSARALACAADRFGVAARVSTEARGREAGAAVAPAATDPALAMATEGCSGAKSDGGRATSAVVPEPGVTLSATLMPWRAASRATTWKPRRCDTDRSMSGGAASRRVGLLDLLGGHPDAPVLDGDQPVRRGGPGRAANAP